MLSRVSGFPVGKYSRIVTPSWLVDKVSGFKHDAVRGCAHGKGGALGQRLINGELAVEEIVQVLSKTEDAALEVGAARAAGEVDIAPIAAVDVFVGVDHQLQGGGLIIASPSGSYRYSLRPYSFRSTAATASRETGT